MRQKVPVLERIQKNLSVTIIGDLSDNTRDSHWIWQGKLPALASRKVSQGLKQPVFRERIQTPPRIRDDDGVTKSVSRILGRIFRGVDIGHAPRRVEGCNYTCVNPFHVKPANSTLPDVEVKPLDEDAEIEALADEVRDFIAANGRDEHAIRDRFGLDYTELEITLALRKITQ